MVARILLQLDSDPAASTFDAVVAVDAGVDHLLRHGGVSPEKVTPLVHGAMFTRGGEALRNTAIFIGGSDVAAAERLLQSVRDCFFGPVRVSVMLDAAGCNTTAAAAVLTAAAHAPLPGATVCVLGGTGPVGQRVAQLAALEGANVLLASRSAARAAEAAAMIGERLAASGKAGTVTPHQADEAESTAALLARAQVVIACGAAGIQLVDQQTLHGAPESLRVAIDLNAVAPAGIESIGPTDKASRQAERILYGAIGVGGLKMKIHREALQTLFTANDRVLEAAEILEIGKQVLAR